MEFKKIKINLSGLKNAYVSFGMMAFLT